MNAAADFVAGHAVHPDARMALALAAAQADAQAASRPGFAPKLALLYLTDRLAEQARAVLDELQQRWPGIVAVGCTGVGIAASGVEYFDEPALSLMLADINPGHWRVFNGRQPLAEGWAHAALVHADPATPDMPALLADAAALTGSGYLFGGLLSSRSVHRHWAGGLFEGGLSGLAFDDTVALRSRVTQGCMPVGPVHRIGKMRGNAILTLDDRPALAALLDDLGTTLDEPIQAMRKLRATLVGLTSGEESMLGRGGQFGTDTRVRHLVGIDPERGAVAIADDVEPGMQLAFCRRDAEAARRDLVRIATELREEAETDAPAWAGAPGAEPEAGRSPIAGAVYVSCAGRGGPHFGAPSAELQIVQRALGDVPLVGFFASGEIARHQLYGYTGVLTVFLAPR